MPLLNYFGFKYMLCDVRWFQAGSAIPQHTYREATTPYLSLLVCPASYDWKEVRDHSLEVLFPC